MALFAETNYRDSRRLFGIKRDDRRRHAYVIGKTGMGKSVLLTQLIYSDIEAGHGVCVVDPHGELAEDILNLIPSHRINDVIYFDPGDMEFPIAFNIMESPDPNMSHLVASGLIGVFKKIWADSWGPRLEYVLRNAILALLDYPGSTLLGTMRILVDKAYRKKVVEKIKDPVVKSFWVEEYSKYPDRFQAEAIAPIQNKVGQFLSNALIRNVVGQVKSAIDVRDVMDNQKILILNLSKGRIGEDSSALLGAMMITKIQLAAMSRIDMAEKDRKDFYLYVDEFQNFATESFANILSEARKYRLNLTIAHQYIEQLDEKVQAAVFGNVGTLMCFRVGAADAEVLVKEFAPYVTEEDLVNLAKWQIYLKLMIDGVASQPFSANTLPPVDVNYGNRDKIIRVTRERYAQPREVIEEKISRWANKLEQESEDDHKRQSAMPPRAERAASPVRAPSTTPTMASTQAPATPPVLKLSDLAAAPVVPIKSVREATPIKAGLENKTPYQYTAVCASCGKETMVSFVPDGKRPVYCKDCLRKIRLDRAAKPVVQLLSKPVQPTAAPQPRQAPILQVKPRAEVPPATAQTITPTGPSQPSTKRVNPGETVFL